MILLFKLTVILPIIILIVVPLVLLFDTGKPTMNEIEEMLSF